MQKHNNFYYTTNTGTKYILFTMTGYRKSYDQINKVLQELSDKTITFPTTNRLITKGQGHNEPFIHASLATLFSDDCKNNDFTMPSYAMVVEQPIGFLIDKDKCKLLNAYKHDTYELNESFDSNTGEKRDTKKYDDTITIDDFANIYRTQDNHYKKIAENKPLNIKEQAMVEGDIMFNNGLHNELHLTSIKENEKIKVYSIFLSLTKNQYFSYRAQLKNLAISLKTIIDKQIKIFGLDTIPLHFVEKGEKIGVFKTLTLKELIIFCETELKNTLNECRFNNFIEKYNINFEDITKYLDAKLEKKEFQTIQELKRDGIIKNQDSIGGEGEEEHQEPVGGEGAGEKANSEPQPEHVIRTRKIIEEQQKCGIEYDNKGIGRLKNGITPEKYQDNLYKCAMDYFYPDYFNPKKTKEEERKNINNKQQNQSNTKNLKNNGNIIKK